MKVKEIYEKYSIPLNLQQHMLRVAGMSKVIIENWKGDSLNANTTITACLVHDIGNLIKFDLVNPEAVAFLGSEAKNIDYWRKVQSEMKQKYGSDDDTTTHLICEELRINSKSMYIVDNWGFGNFDKVLTSNNWEYKICVYSDHRIGPNGVLSLKERFENQRKRYLKNPNKNNSATISSHLSVKAGMLANCSFEVEKQIQANVLIDLSSITDQEVETNFDLFLEREL